MLHKKTVLAKKRHFYVKKAVFLQIERLWKNCFFTEIYFCEKAAFLCKKLFFYKIYFCNKAAFLCKNAAFVHI